MSNRITFDTKIDIAPFRNYIRKMEDAVDTFASNFKGKINRASEALGGIGSNFQLPEFDFSSFDTEKIDYFIQSFSKLNNKFYIAQQKATAFSESLNAFSALEDTAYQFEAVEESVSRVSSAFSGLNEASIITERSFSILSTDLRIIKNNFDHLKTALSGLGGKLRDLSSGALDAFRLGLDKVKNSALLAKTKKVLLTAKTAILTTVKKVFNLVAKANPIGLIVVAVGLLIAGIVALVKNWDYVKEAVLNFVERAKEFLSGLWERIRDIAKNIKEAFINAWNSVKEGVSNVVERIKNWFSSVWDTVRRIIKNIQGAFSNAWEKVGEGVSVVGDVIRGVFDRIFGFIKGIINGIIRVINGLISGIVSGINTIIRGLNSINFSVPNWVPIIGGNSFGFNIPKFNAPQIPELARGGIVSQPTLALIGERGKEAVMPLENNTGWITDLANSIGAVVAAQLSISQTEKSDFNTFGYNKPIQLYLDGKKVAEGILDDLISVAERRDIGLYPLFR